MIVGICGYKRVGKDTAADAFRGFNRYALADPLRTACCEIFGWDRKRIEDKEAVDPFWGISPRRAMQVVGTELFRQHLVVIEPSVGNVWINSMVRRYLACKQNLVVSDVRFPDEADAIRQLGGWILRIHRPGYGPGDHASERRVDEISPDAVIHNDGTIADLHDQVAALLESVDAIGSVV